jgi:hypothetical protein
MTTPIKNILLYGIVWIIVFAGSILGLVYATTNIEKAVLGLVMCAATLIYFIIVYNNIRRLEK